MSLTGINKLWNMTVKTRESILKKYFAAREKKLAQLKMKKRHLALDPLEERHLLSLTIGSVDDVLVNTEWQDIRGEVAADVNASNDVVAAWTAADQLTDPVTGEVIGEDLNVYARYLTDETQVVTIAIETTQIGKGASFELLYGSAAVQRLSFYSSTPIKSNSTVYDSDTGLYSYVSNKNIVGEVTLSLNGNEFTFEYDSTLTPTVNARNIQKAIRSLGADYAEIEVTAFSETEFDITYLGENFAGTVPELKVASQTYTSGSTPSALIETISSPTTITNYSLLTGKQIGITITSDTAAMASQLEKAFERTASDAYYAPVMRQWYYDTEALTYAARISDELESAYRADTSYDYYTTRVFPNLEVNVTALDTQVEGDYTYYRFEVTFTGNSGYKNHQELLVSSLHIGGTEMIEDGYTYVNGSDPLMNGQSLVETIKESSPVFRVNSPEEAQYAKDDEGNVIYDRNGDPVLIGTGKTDQYNPDVAFADNGTFTVVWQSDIDEVTDRYNYTDIYARRFTIQGYSADESKVNFYAFTLVSAENMDFSYRREQMEWLESQGFTVVERMRVGNISDESMAAAGNKEKSFVHPLRSAVRAFSERIAENDFPSDGLVLSFDDIAYGRSLGETSKFPRDSIAFKWADENAETVLREIEWSASRTGLINPVAIFDPVELEGTTVSRASVHNLSVMKQLELGIGDRIMVYKANMIIPQISENLTRSGRLDIPEFCPVCAGKTEIRNENGSETLYCINPDCAAKKIKAFEHFVSRDAMNIEGLSEATLEKFIARGFVGEYADLFRLSRFSAEISEMDGFGSKSFENLRDAAEKASHTTCARLLNALGIPNIGVANARSIARECGGSFERARKLSASELTEIDGIGDIMAASYTEFFGDPGRAERIDELLKYLSIDESASKPSPEQNLSGLSFVITGSLNHFENRKALQELIESRGGKASGSVSAKTSFLINNDSASGSTKNKTAKSLGVAIITEDEFIERFLK